MACGGRRAGVIRKKPTPARRLGENGQFGGRRGGWAGRPGARGAGALDRVSGRCIASTIFHSLSAFDHLPVAMTLMRSSRLLMEGKARHVPTLPRGNDTRTAGRSAQTRTGGWLILVRRCSKGAPPQPTAAWRGDNLPPVVREVHRRLYASTMSARVLSMNAMVSARSVGGTPNVPSVALTWPMKASQSAPPIRMPSWDRFMSRPV